MNRNPYEPPRASDPAVDPAAKSLSFPFDLVARVVFGAALCLLGSSSLFMLHGEWARLSDLAIIQPTSNPWIYVVLHVAMVPTGATMLMRTRFAFLPFGVYCIG